jgi:hypothetical protein
VVALALAGAPGLPAQDKDDALPGKVPRNAEPCLAAYHAVQMPGTVVLFAEGFHATSGYQVFFEKRPPDVYPPEFALWHVKPAGDTAPVLTPFAVWTTFAAPSKVKRVVVSDADGKHEIPVKPPPEAQRKLFEEKAAERAPQPSPTELVTGMLTGPLAAFGERHAKPVKPKPDPQPVPKIEPKKDPKPSPKPENCTCRTCKCAGEDSNYSHPAAGPKPKSCGCKDNPKKKDEEPWDVKKMKGTWKPNRKEMPNITALP